MFHTCHGRDDLNIKSRFPIFYRNLYVVVTKLFLFHHTLHIFLDKNAHYLFDNHLCKGLFSLFFYSRCRYCTQMTLNGDHDINRLSCLYYYELCKPCCWVSWRVLLGLEKVVSVDIFLTGVDHWWEKLIECNNILSLCIRLGWDLR